MRHAHMQGVEEVITRKQTTWTIEVIMTSDKCPQRYMDWKRLDNKWRCKITSETCTAQECRLKPKQITSNLIMNIQ
jgi:hypothetical protein